MAREGLIPTLLGTAVTASGIAMKMPGINKRGMQKQAMSSAIATGIIGFGLAHVVLGSIDLLQGR
jgi:hypothetical protein